MASTLFSGVPSLGPTTNDPSLPNLNSFPPFDDSADKTAMWNFFDRIVSDIPKVVSPPDEASMLPDIDPALLEQDGVHQPSDDQITNGMDIDAIAFGFAERHRTALAALCEEFGLTTWVRFCDRLLLKFASRVGTDSLRAFRRRDREEIVAWLIFEHEEMVREGYVFEDQEVILRMVVKRVEFIDPGRSRIDDETFLEYLVKMVTHDMQRVVFAAWLDAAKSIEDIVSNDGTDDPVLQARSFFSHGTYHGVSTFNFFNDLDASPDAPAKLFTGKQARMAIDLALRNVTPLVEDTFFGIFDRVRDGHNANTYRLLRSSPSHTTNVILSMVLLVMNGRARNRPIPALSERKLCELKDIFEENRRIFHEVIACSQASVPMAMQQLFSYNLLNILPS